MYPALSQAYTLATVTTPEHNGVDDLEEAQAVDEEAYVESDYESAWEEGTGHEYF